MKIDKKIRITVLSYVKIGNNDSLLYVINADNKHEFRYLNNKQLKLVSTDVTGFIMALKKMKNINNLTMHEIIIWLFEIGTEYVFPEQDYLKYTEEVRALASNQPI